MINPIMAHNEWLFDQIFQRDPDTNSTCEGILLPDTIIYKYF